MDKKEMIKQAADGMTNSDAFIMFGLNYKDPEKTKMACFSASHCNSMEIVMMLGQFMKEDPQGHDIIMASLHQYNKALKEEKTPG